MQSTICVHRVRVGLWHRTAFDAVQQVIVTAAHLVARFPDDIQQVTRCFQIHGDRFCHIRHNPHRRDHQRTGDGVAFTVFPQIFVIEAVLAADERRTISHRRVITTLRRPHHRAESIRQAGIAPAEVIENGDLVGVCANRHQITHCLIHRRPGHRIRINRAVLRTKPIRERDSFHPLALCIQGEGNNHRRITRPVIIHAHQRLDRRAALHLMIVTADDALLAANIGMRQQSQQGIGQVGCASAGGFQTHPYSGGG